MNCRKSAQEHIQSTMEKKSLSSLFVALSEPRYCHATKKTSGSKIFSLYCNWREVVWGKNVNGDPVAREEFRTHHMLNLSVDFEKANQKAIKFCKDLNVTKRLYLTDEPTHQNPYNYRTPEEIDAEKKWETIKHEIWAIRGLKNLVKKHSYKIADLRTKRLTPSNYYGEVGDRSELNLTLQFNVDFHSNFNGRPVIRWMNNLVDDKGNVFVYWGNKLGNKGDVISLKATIKSHDVYKGVKQTIINRPKVIEILDQVA